MLFLKDLNYVKAGYIDIINESLDKGGCIYLEKYLTLDTDREKQNIVKWFATKSEAEEFAKTLVEPVKCGNGILDAVEPKQPLKQAVHCKTQEEWDFVTEKLGYKWTEGRWNKYGEYTCIEIGDKGYGTSDLAFKNYQILSFQEWCDLNGYKMEKEVKFEVGDWMVLGGNHSHGGYSIGDLIQIESLTGNTFTAKEKNSNKLNTGFSLTLNRHATPEEINNHLISIGQIPAGEPLNTGIEPNKDVIYQVDKKHQEDLIRQGIKIRDEFFKSGNTQSPPKMTLSIDDEELPMVNIIKTNSIKQLLNND